MKADLKVLFFLFATMTLFTRSEATEQEHVARGADRGQAAVSGSQQRIQSKGGGAAVHQPSNFTPRSPSMSHSYQRAHPAQGAVVNKPVQHVTQPQRAVNRPQQKIHSINSVRGANVHQPSNFTPRSPSPSMIRSYQQLQHHQGRINASQNNVKGLKQQVQQFKHQPKQPQAVRVQTKGLNSYKNRTSNNRRMTQDLTSRVRSSHPQYHNWFNNDFFRGHHYHPRFEQARANWWNGTNWYGAQQWLGWDDSVYPMYYDDQDSFVQVNIDAGNDYQTNVSQENYIQADQGDWLPLGVFALGADTAQAAYSNIFIQLAMDKQEGIAGSYYNASADLTYPIEGYIDATTQQVYWRITQGADTQVIPVMSTSVYDLTQDVANIRLTFPGGIIQNWVLIRVNQ